MPKRKRTRGKRKRTFKRRRFRGRRKRSIRYSPTPFPRVFKTRMSYVDTLTFNPTAAGIDTEIYRATSVYDPWTGVGGHQPRYFDQVMPMYDHFVVCGAKLTCTFTNTDTANPAVVAVGLFDDGSPLSSMNDYMENKHSHYKVVNTRDTTGPVYLTAKYSPKFLGKFKPLSSDELKGTIGSDPTENAYFHIVCGPMDGASDLGNVRCLIRLEYLVAFVEPNTVSQS